MGIPLEDMEVTLTHKANIPPGDDPLNVDRIRKLRMAKIKREIRFMGLLSEAHREQLMQEAKMCPVSNTLSQSTRIEDVELN